MKKLDGFIGRRLQYAENTDQWLEIVEWSNMDLATRAADAINASADCLDYITLNRWISLQDIF